MPTTEKVKIKGNKVIVSADEGYCSHVKKLLVMTDTGNGYKLKFCSSSSVQQDIFMSLDYAQAADLLIALKAVESELVGE